MFHSDHPNPNQSLQGSQPLLKIRINLEKLMYICAWLEHLYHFEWCALLYTILCNLDNTVALASIAIYLLIRHAYNWFDIKKAQINLNILTSILKNESES